MVRLIYFEMYSTEIMLFGFYGKNYFMFHLSFPKNVFEAFTFKKNILCYTFELYIILNRFHAISKRMCSYFKGFSIFALNTFLSHAWKFRKLNSI